MVYSKYKTAEIPYLVARLLLLVMEDGQALLQA